MRILGRQRSRRQGGELSGDNMSCLGLTRARHQTYGDRFSRIAPRTWSFLSPGKLKAPENATKNPHRKGPKDCPSGGFRKPEKCILPSLDRAEGARVPTLQGIRRGMYNAPPQGVGVRNNRRGRKAFFEADPAEDQGGSQVSQEISQCSDRGNDSWAILN